MATIAPNASAKQPTGQLTKFTDAVGREAYKDASGRVYTKGGSQDTFYNVSEWNARQLKKYGQGGTSGGSTSAKGATTSTTSGSPTGFDLNKVYENAYNSADIKQLEDTLNQRKQALTTAQVNINDNPFYSEATRVGKLSKLQQQAQSEIANMSDELAQKKADAQTKVNIALKQYDIQQQEYQQQLQKLNTLISTGAILDASGNDIAQIALATGLSTDMIKSIQKKAQSDQIKPIVKDYVDNNGNVSLVVLDGNTGAVVSQRSLGSVGASKTTGTSGISTSKVTDKDVGKAIAIIAKADTSNYGTADKLLSPWEIQDSYNQLLSAYGDENVAKKLLLEAMNRGGYSEWKQ